ncbi:MAG: hypothetical protein FJ303_00735 [Planctomycetes bacterium]|nr:hypothetical protein [Planctomycetota bacterium]
MSHRVKQLAAMLNAMPQPRAEVEKNSLNGLKRLSEDAVLASEMEGMVPKRRELLAEATETLDKFADLIGRGHPAVVLVRKMILIADAIVEGRPEPSDSDLDRMINGGGGGCFSILILTSAGVATLAYGAWHFLA